MTLLSLLFCYRQQQNGFLFKDSTQHVQFINSYCQPVYSYYAVKQIIGTCMKHFIIFVCNHYIIIHLHNGILTKKKALLKKSNVNVRPCFYLSKIKPQNVETESATEGLQGNFFCFMLCAMKGFFFLMNQEANLYFHGT